MKRIEQQSSFSQDLAKRILGWVTFSTRPLTAIELQDAIAVEIGEPEFDQTNIIDIEEMISVCSGLIVVEENSNIAKLVHFTAQEYARASLGIPMFMNSSQTPVSRICRSTTLMILVWPKMSLKYSEGSTSFINTRLMS
jgi:hypothetical protein